MPGIVFAECPSGGSRLLSLRLSVLVRHTCMGKYVAVLYSSSYTVVPKVSLSGKWLSLWVVTVYYVTLQVDKEHKNAFSALKLESSSPVQ